MSPNNRIIATGMALPERCVPNDELSKELETSDDWIFQRTGIRQRYVAAEHETTSTLASGAAQMALERAGLGGQDIDLIVLATSTPDHTFPASATQVQANIGMDGGAAFDVQAVCTGFVYALATADAMLKAGHGERALVIGAETFSRILDWTDRTTCVLFGDGAGAVILEKNTSGHELSRGIFRTKLRSDGKLKDKLFVDGGPSLTGSSGHVKMQGREVYKLAVGMVPATMEEILAEEGIPAKEIDWFVPHQANERIIDATAVKLGIPLENVVKTVDKHANTSAASIPLALATYDQQGKFKPKDLMLLEAMGGGFTWGGVLLRW